MVMLTKFITNKKMTYNFKESISKKIKFISFMIIRSTLGVGFFLHGFGKLPLPPEKLSSWFESMSMFAPEIIASLVAIGEIAGGIGIIVGGLITGKFGDLLTRLSALFVTSLLNLPRLLIFIIMIGAFYIAHPDWFINKKLFMSEQIYIFALSIFFLMNGNKR